LYKVTLYLKTFFEFFRFKILKGIIYTEREGHGVGVGVPPRFLVRLRLHARVSVCAHAQERIHTYTRAHVHVRSHTGIHDH